jgi:hypothetical protein
MIMFLLNQRVEGESVDPRDGGRPRDEELRQKAKGERRKAKGKKGAGKQFLSFLLPPSAFRRGPTNDPRD